MHSSMSYDTVGARPGQMGCFFPGVKVYLQSAGLADPFSDAAIFRGEECFDGSLKGWQRWTRPSPEPVSDSGLNSMIISALEQRGPYLAALHDILLERILARAGSRPVLLIAILRAGVFVSAGLAARARLRKGLELPVAAMALFHEAGFDRSALEQILADHPGFWPVLVDGWTGRGVAVAEIRKSIAAYAEETGAEVDWPVATLVDPGHYGDIWASDCDILVDCAHFSAPEVLGFSRAFIEEPGSIWRAYEYPRDYRNQALIDAWFDIFACSAAIVSAERGEPQDLKALLSALSRHTGVPARDWKVNSNEVARTFVNRQPRTLMLGMDEETARREMSAFIYLAGKKEVMVEYAPWMNDEHHCLAAVRLR